MLLPIGFGFVVLSFSAFTLINNSGPGSFEKVYTDLSAFISEQTKSIFSKGGYHEATILRTRRQNLYEAKKS